MIWKNFTYEVMQLLRAKPQLPHLKTQVAWQGQNNAKEAMGKENETSDSQLPNPNSNPHPHKMPKPAQKPPMSKGHGTTENLKNIN